MIRPRRYIPVLLILIGFGVWVARPRETTPQEPAPLAFASSTDSGASAQGSVVVRDKDTGELRPPTEREWRELAVDQSLRLPTNRRPVEAERRPDGTLSVVSAYLPASFSVAVLDEEGRVKMTCREDESKEGAEGHDGR